ncbi:MAG: trypsin-like peptidase domain-containing protein [Nitrospira sp.]|nr:trypsin-like peptidase domain-containing protein [Nitrospira sp.]
MLVLALLLQLSFQSEAQASKEEDSLLTYPAFVAPGPVLRLSGSGVLLGTANTTYLLTARHVFVNDMRDTLVKPGGLVRARAADPKESMSYVVKLDLNILRNSENWKEDKEHDVLLVRLIHNQFPVEGVHVTHEPKSGPSMIPLPDVHGISEIASGKVVYIAGYRTSIIPNNANGSELNSASVRGGKILLYTIDDGKIVSDYHAYSGDSGAPIFMFTESGITLVGVHIGRQDAITNNGSKRELAIATSTQYVLELISSFH